MGFYGFQRFPGVARDDPTSLAPPSGGPWREEGARRGRSGRSSLVSSVPSIREARFSEAGPARGGAVKTEMKFESKIE